MARRVTAMVTASDPRQREAGNPAGNRIHVRLEFVSGPNSDTNTMQRDESVPLAIAAATHNLRMSTVLIGQERLMYA
jgi:hypothetical protein